MEDLNDFIMYFALLSLYVKDRDSNLLDPFPRMVLEQYIISMIVTVIGEKFNISEEQIVEMSKQKIKSKEAAIFLAQYGARVLRELEDDK